MTRRRTPILGAHASKVLRPHGYRINEKEYLARLERQAQTTGNRPCVYGHGDCSLRQGGPCYDELVSAMEQDQPYTMARITPMSKPDQPSRAQIFRVEFPHWRRHLAGAQVSYLRDDHVYDIILEVRLSGMVHVEQFTVDGSRAMSHREALEELLRDMHGAMRRFREGAVDCIKSGREFLARARQVAADIPAGACPLRALPPVPLPFSRYYGSDAGFLNDRFNRILARHEKEVVKGDQGRFKVVSTLPSSAEALQETAEFGTGSACIW